MLVSMYLAVLPADPLGPDVSAVLGGYRGVADGATLPSTEAACGSYDT